MDLQKSLTIGESKKLFIEFSLSFYKLILKYTDNQLTLCICHMTTEAQNSNFMNYSPIRKKNENLIHNFFQDMTL